MTKIIMTEEHDLHFRTGFLTIIGRPNVGKSTLLNRLIGQKISIVSRKAQTTRHRINGILTKERCQYIFVDTPGFQKRYTNALNRTMNRSVISAVQDVDVILFVIEAGNFTPADAEILPLLPEGSSVVLILNKIDHIKDKTQLLPFIAEMSALHSFAEIVPLSASTGKGCQELLTALVPYLPLRGPIFPADDLTDRSERFLAAEFLREKLFRMLGEELPYSMTVEIEKFETEGKLRRIHAAIIVDRPGHKAMVIGKKGEQLKTMATDARIEMEKLFGSKVFLEVWVKVRSGWSDDLQALKSLGYE